MNMFPMHYYAYIIIIIIIIIKWLKELKNLGWFIIIILQSI